jgi:drug/metabolite transporter (DMT)-like permease
MPPQAAGSAWPAAALLVNAFVWGVSWWPFRWLEAQGLHALWATTIVYALSSAVILAWRPRAFAGLLRHPALWWIVLASGTTNAAYNWAVTFGDVVRVVLLCYLMPLWAVLFARVLLDERPDAAALARVGMALAGAVVVLWPSAGAGTSPRLADALGLVAGASFALNNVLLRREAASPPEARALAMFGGGAVVALGLAIGLGAAGGVPAPPPAAAGWIAGALLLGLFFLAGNLALQYGAGRLPAHVTAVVLVSEVLFAAVSALALGASTASWPLAAGGALIVGASLLAARPAQPAQPVDQSG